MCVEQMLNAVLIITVQFARVVMDSQEIHLPFAIEYPVCFFLLIPYN